MGQRMNSHTPDQPAPNSPAAPTGVVCSDLLDADDEAYKLTEENEAIAEAERCYWMVEAQ
jgi:hypothetical protein